MYRMDRMERRMGLARLCTMHIALLCAVLHAACSAAVSCTTEEGTAPIPNNSSNNINNKKGAFIFLLKTYLLNLVIDAPF